MTKEAMDENAILKERNKQLKLRLKHIVGQIYSYEEEAEKEQGTANVL